MQQRVPANLCLLLVVYSRFEVLWQAQAHQGDTCTRHTRAGTTPEACQVQWQDLQHFLHSADTSIDSPPGRKQDTASQHFTDGRQCQPVSLLPVQLFVMHAEQNLIGPHGIWHNMHKQLSLLSCKLHQQNMSACSESRVGTWKAATYS